MRPRRRSRRAFANAICPIEIVSPRLAWMPAAFVTASLIAGTDGGRDGVVEQHRDVLAFDRARARSSSA